MRGHWGHYGGVPVFDVNYEQSRASLRCLLSLNDISIDKSASCPGSESCSSLPTVRQQVDVGCRRTKIHFWQTCPRRGSGTGLVVRVPWGKAGAAWVTCRGSCLLAGSVAATVIPPWLGTIVTGCRHKASQLTALLWPQHVEKNARLQ